MCQSALRLACLVCLMFATNLAQAESDSYLRGYGQALLDQYFPDQRLEARQGKEPGVLVVAGQGCLAQAKRSEIAQKLTGSGPIVEVKWNVECRGLARTPASTQPEVAFTFLPTTELFRPLEADPQESQFSLTLQRHDFRGRDFTAGIVSAGETFSLVEGNWGENAWQIGIQGAVFALFDLDAEKNDLLNADYLVALPLTYRDGPWSTRARIYHQSSHLGDEFIFNNPNVARQDISFEALDLILSHDWENFRLYGGGGYIIRTSEDRDRLMLQLGGEWRHNDIIGDIDLSLATDLKSSEEQEWVVSQSYQGAFIFTRSQREIRVLLQYYNGRSHYGQFFRDDLDYFGLGLQFGI